MRSTDITSKGSDACALLAGNLPTAATQWLEKLGKNAHLLLKASNIASFIPGAKYCHGIIAGDVGYFETWPKSTNTRGP